MTGPLLGSPFSCWILYFFSSFYEPNDEGFPFLSFTLMFYSFHELPQKDLFNIDLICTLSLVTHQMSESTSQHILLFSFLISLTNQRYLHVFFLLDTALNKQVLREQLSFSYISIHSQGHTSLTKPVYSPALYKLLSRVTLYSTISKNNFIHL